METKRFFIVLLYLTIAISLVGWSVTQADLAFAKGAAPEQSLKSIAKGVALAAALPELPAESVAAASELSVAGLGTAAATCTQWHTILAGETLAKIGRRYDVSWRELAEINNLSNPNLIYAGARLCITTDNGTPVPTPTPNPVPSGRIPTFSIVEVVRDDMVTILTKNFPAEDRFIVRMGLIGTRGVNGVEVERIDSGDGGSFTATFEIPASLKGLRQISVRLESPTSGYFSYNWFYNSTTN